MPVETATNINALNPLWPLGTDPRSEGDDHLRMIKTVLQAAISDDGTTGSFKNAQPPKLTILTANTTTFQFDAASRWAEVEVIGGGAGGAGVDAASGSAASGLACAGAGGGGGGTARKAFVITAAIRAATKTIVVGAGGIGGTGTALQATPGALSSYADSVNTLTANGGGVGANGTFGSSVILRTGGIGGTATGGDFNQNGGPGLSGAGYGQAALNNTGFATAASGMGGDTTRGVGGRGSTTLVINTPLSVAGGAGFGFGAGGGGSCNIGNISTALAGGAGAPGVVIIREYRS
jgi:hypothetical protein